MSSDRATSPSAGAVAALLISIFVAASNTSLSNVALPAIARDLHIDPSSAVWVANAYQLAVAMCLLPFGALGDIVGLHRINVLGLSLFCLASLASALATSEEMLIAARACVGVSAAAVLAVNQGLIRICYPDALFGRGIAINAAVIASSQAMGPSLGSAVLAFASWRWVFALSVPLSLLALVASWLTLPATARVPRKFDAVAVTMSALMLGLLIFGLHGMSVGRSPVAISAELVGGVAVGALFVHRLLRDRDPILPIRMFGNARFSLSLVALLCSFVAQGLALVSLPFFLEEVLHYTHRDVGLVLTAWPITIALVAPLAGRLSGRYPASILGGIGLATLCSGFVGLAFLDAAATKLDVVWRLVLCGAGIGLFQTPNTRSILSGTSRDRASAVSSFLASTRAIGSTAGAAIVAIVFASSGPRSGTGVHAAMLIAIVGAAVAAIGAVVSLLRGERAR